MGDVGQLRYSKNLLERAAYWAATCSWLTADDFEDGQRDCKTLQALAKLFDDQNIELTVENVERGLRLIHVEEILGDGVSRMDSPQDASEWKDSVL